MGSAAAPAKVAVGFLTVVVHPQHGLFGGYLLLNVAGRPLEFHCTAPIKPNRAQEILYGPTLDAYLYGEQIGQTLVGRGGHQPLMICTDQPAVMAMRPHVSVPVALVLSREAACATEPAGRQWRIDGPHASGPALVTLEWGVNRLAVSPAADDQQAFVDRFSELAEGFDLAEPFDRIRAAIEEARQAVRSP